MPVSCSLRSVTLLPLTWAVSSRSRITWRELPSLRTTTSITVPVAGAVAGLGPAETTVSLGFAPSGTT
ncbi:hypothetical protein [Nitrospirillum sp. BR 11828]|uniref:hypothetical protein n=1 Tax=Nitrospirillum sp. BR 11828 TaxID=3104325 RepID=UPI002ACA915D|nr:hypothetical protein [Nitrospirillum sp. BR 11828]MDZ5649345.1 hypothetical protein [Nitrospirillum sp. BR 11828]